MRRRSAELLVRAGCQRPSIRAAPRRSGPGFTCSDQPTMGRRKKVIGTCCLCGEHRELTFEHVPPRKAFNDNTVVLTTLKELIRTTVQGDPRGRQQQRGAGAYTLCGPCNNNTGDWYARDLVRLCQFAMRVLESSGGRPAIVPLKQVRPLRIIKQIVTMFMSLNGPGFGGETLRRFCLDRKRVGLPPNYRFFVYYAVGPKVRYMPVSIESSFSSPGVHWMMSELAFPPLGYLMTLDTPPPDRRLVEITEFARCRDDDEVYWELRLPVMPTVTATAGDYRGMSEVEATGRRNLALERARRRG